MSATARWLLGSTVVGLIVIGSVSVWLWPVLTMLGDPNRIARTYYIPSESMLPTLAFGDRVRPLVPSAARLTRGTIVVFNGADSVRIARIVAVGGDTVAMRAGHLAIQGRSVDLRSAGNGPTLSDGTATRLQIERLPGEVGTHRLLDAGTSIGDDVASVKVPAGHFYVLGDDRDRAADSRFPVEQMGVGLVDANQMIGIVDKVLWSASFGDRGRPIDEVKPSKGAVG